MSRHSQDERLGLPQPPALLPLLLLLLAVAVPLSQAGVYYATAYWMPTEKTIQVKNVLDRKGDAYGFYNNSVKTTGWGILEIKAGYGSQSLSNEIIMFAAGFLEGYLTAPHMDDHFTNLYPQLIKKRSMLNKVQDFLTKQDQWTRENIKYYKSDPFWRHADYVMAQMDGLFAGATKRAVLEGKKPMTLFQIQFLNAIGDLLDLIPSLSPTKNSSLKFFKRWDMGHCSALIKVLPGFENIFFAHSSWYTYAAMLRIYKHWDFNIVDKDTSSSRLSFSSYPGYWPSYNIPFHEKVYNWSGYPILVKKLGLDYSYDLASRAKIFRRDQGKVTDMESMKYIMRYNNYKQDPYSKGDPCNTVCCREDLNSHSPSPGGCYDTKSTQRELLELGRNQAKLSSAKFYLFEETRACQFFIKKGGRHLPGIQVQSLCHQWAHRTRWPPCFPLEPF
ncbi:phospholipase B-like 1 isoform X2 [Bos taurus]|uniref:phospholipase B-like 1 isoform X2 n=1 Tax=Bos taurus TaxID=9913 RepID=UPI000572B152|nr:phospholipase B-like 1 isoform X2 [Bos taurus]